MSMYMCPVLLILQSIEQECMAPIWHSCRRVEDSFWHTALQYKNEQQHLYRALWTLGSLCVARLSISTANCSRSAASMAAICIEFNTATNWHSLSIAR